MGIVLKGGRIITAADSYEADIKIEGEKIVAIGDKLECEGDKVVSVAGCYLLPGGIDPHTHFDLDVGSTITADDFESGTRAAIVGGTTTVIDFATQNKGETLKKALQNWNEKAKGKCYCDYGFHMAITDWNESICNEMGDMIKEGVPSFKMYMAYKNTLQVDDGSIFRALKKSGEIGALIGFHCENGDVIDVLVNEAKSKGNTSPKYHAETRPTEAEKEAVFRAIQLGELASVPVYIVHLSSKEALNIAMEARKRGAEVYVETCPQYLLLNDSYYDPKGEDEFSGAKYVMSPPLRKSDDQKALWKGLKFNEIDTVATDHCSFNYKGQKDIGIKDFSKIPNGAPGVENRMALLYTYGVATGAITENQWVSLTSTNAAKLFGLFPQKGTIQVGSDADIVVWDPEYRGVITAENQTQNVDYNPYEGFDQRGKVLHVFLRGGQVVVDSNIVPKVPEGTYLHRKPFSKK